MLETRQWAYSTLKAVSIEKALLEDVAKICDFLAKETGYSSNRWKVMSPKKSLTDSMIKAVECAKMKRELNQTIYLLSEINENNIVYKGDHDLVFIPTELIKEIEDFLNREGK